MNGAVPPLDELCQEWGAILAFSRAGGTVLVAVTTVVAASLAWLVKSLVAWMAWAYLRFLERIELLRAIRAEIEANLASEAYYGSSEGRDRLLQRMRDRSKYASDFIPYVAVVDSKPMYGEIGSLKRLPAPVIDMIVTYYNYSSGLGAQLADLRSDAFRSIDRARQQAVIRDLFDVAGRSTVDSGSAAARTISRTLLTYQIQDVVLRLALVFASAVTIILVPPQIVAGLSVLRQVAGSASRCVVPLVATP